MSDKLKVIKIRWLIKMNNSTMPSYDNVTKALKTLKALTEASESHGLLCALFCVGADVRQAAWIDSMLTDHIQDGDIMVQQATDNLNSMFEVTKFQYQSDFLILSYYYQKTALHFTIELEHLHYGLKDF